MSEGIRDIANAVHVGEGIWRVDGFNAVSPGVYEQSSWASGALAARRGTYARNLITWAGGVLGSSTLHRTVTYADGTTATLPVAGAVGVQATAPGMWVDGDVPFGPDVIKVEYLFAGSRVTVPGLNFRWSIISDPFSGRSVTVIGSEAEGWSWESATEASWLQVRVGGYPQVHAWPEQAPTEQISVYTTSKPDRLLLAELFATRRPLLLRTAESGVPDRWFTVAGQRAEKRISNKRVQDEWRIHTWQALTVERPDPATSGGHGGDTLGDLAAAVPTTLADIAARWATLGDIAMDQLVPERQVEL